jgi:flavin-binding protein dodecin
MEVWMSTKKTSEFTGYSNASIHEAIQNAREKAGDPLRFSIVESFGVHIKEEEKEYQVLLRALED